MIDALFFILLGLINVLVYFGKVKLINDSKINEFVVGKKLKLIFLWCGIGLILLGLVWIGLIFYEQNFV